MTNYLMNYYSFNQTHYNLQELKIASAFMDYLDYGYLELANDKEREYEFNLGCAVVKNLLEQDNGQHTLEEIVERFFETASDFQDITKITLKDLF